MANKGTIGGKIVLEGEREYRQALSQINTSTRTLSSEMRMVTAQYRDNANTTEALRARQQVLNRQLEQQNQSLSTYRSALATANTNLERCSTNVSTWREKLASAEQELERMKNDTSTTNDQLEEQQRVVDQNRRALEQAEGQYNATSQRLQTWETRMNDAQAQLFTLNSDIEQNSRYLDEAERSTDGCATSIDRYGREVRQSEESTTRFGDVVRANLTSAAIIGGIKTLASTVKSLAVGLVELGTGAASYADDIMTMSTQTHVSTDELQAFNYASELMDVSLETLTKSMAKNIKSMTNAQRGSENFVESYKALGVSVTDTNGNLRDGQEVFWDCIDALRSIDDETTADSIAMQLFGKSAQDLNPLIEKGSAGFKQLASEAKSVGAIMDKDTLSALGDTDDAFQRMTQSIEIVKRKIGAQLAPVLTQAFGDISGKANEMGDKIADMVKGAVQGLIDAFKWIAANGSTIKSILVGIVTGLVLTKAVAGVQALITSFIALKTAIAAAGTAGALLSGMSGIGGLGLLVGVVGGVAVAVGGLLMSMKDTNDATEIFNQKVEESNQKAEEMQQSVKALHDEYKSGVSSIEAETQSSKKLADELYALSDKSKLTVAEQARMSTIVDMLNQKYPQLNLKIDENTHQLNKAKTAVVDLINAQKQQALYDITYDKQKAAMENLLKATTDQTVAENNLKDAKKKVKDAENEEEQARRKLDNATKNNSASIDQCNADVEQAITNTNNLTVAKEKAQSAFDNSTDSVELAQSAYDGLSTELQTFADKQGIAINKTDELSDATKDSADTASEAAKKIEDAYHDQYKAAYDSIHGQMSLFDPFENKTKVSGKKLLKNLDSQVDGLKDWQKSLTKISKVGSEDFVQALRDMGPQAAGEIKALAKLSKPELKKYQELWREKNQAISTAAVKAVGDMGGQITKEQAKVRAKIEKDKSLWSKTGGYLGGALGAGVNSGLEKYRNETRTTAIGLCSSVLYAMQHALEVNSPSKKAIKIFSSVGEGAVVGLEKQRNAVKKASVNLSNLSLNSMSSTMTAGNYVNGGTQNTSQVGIRGMVREEMKSALKDLTISVDGKVLGKVVDSNMRRSLA